MIQIYTLLFSLMLIACNQVRTSPIKCDYYCNNISRNISSYYTVIQYEENDTVIQYSYFDVDSNYVILNNKSFKNIELFSDTAYFLYNSICLKKNVNIGMTWPSKHGEIPVIVTLQKIEQGMILGSYEFKQLYVYEIEYDTDYWTLEFTDCILYFDFDMKIVLLKHTYNEGRLIGTDRLIKVTNYNPTVERNSSYDKNR